MVYERLSQQKVTLWLPNWGIKETDMTSTIYVNWKFIRWQNDIILMTNMYNNMCNASDSFHHKLSLLYIKKTNCHNINISRLPSQSMYVTCIIHTSKCGENILLDCITETCCVCHTVYQLPFGCLAWILITPPAWYVS